MPVSRLAALAALALLATGAIAVDLMAAHNDDGVALDGYSVVSYFARDTAERGDPQFRARHDGLTYYFTDQAQRDLFVLAPEKYLPAHGGWCSLMLSGSGNLTPANPESYKIVDDQLLLFWSGDYKGQAISGLRNWASKTKDKARKETSRRKAADKAWQKIVDGKASPKILTFSPADNARLNEQQRSQAVQQY